MGNTFAIFEKHMRLINKKMLEASGYCDEFCSIKLENISTIERLFTTRDKRFYEVLKVNVEIKYDNYSVAALIKADGSNVKIVKFLNDFVLPEDLPFVDDDFSSNMHVVMWDKNENAYLEVSGDIIMEYIPVSIDKIEYFAGFTEYFNKMERRPCHAGYERLIYFDKEEIILLAAEIVRHYGYVKKNDADLKKGKYSTSDMIYDYYMLYNNPEEMDADRMHKLREEKEEKGFNPDSQEAHKLVRKFHFWIDNNINDNKFIRKIKALASLDHVILKDFSVLASVFQKIDENLDSEWVGNAGEDVTINVSFFRELWSDYKKSSYLIIDDKENFFLWETSKKSRCMSPKFVNGVIRGHIIKDDIKYTTLTPNSIAC